MATAQISRVRATEAEILYVYIYIADHEHQNFRCFSRLRNLTAQERTAPQRVAKRVSFRLRDIDIRPWSFLDGTQNL